MESGGLVVSAWGEEEREASLPRSHANRIMVTLLPYREAHCREAFQGHTQHRGVGAAGGTSAKSKTELGIPGAGAGRDAAGCPWPEPVSFNSRRESSVAALQRSILAPPQGWREKALTPTPVSVSTEIDVLGACIFVQVGILLTPN